LGRQHHGRLAGVAERTVARGVEQVASSARANRACAAVLHLWKKTGHETGDRLKRAAETGGAAGLPVAGVGAAALVRALAGDGEGKGRAEVRV
jgi:hypothetical protein